VENASGKHLSGGKNLDFMRVVCYNPLQERMHAPTLLFPLVGVVVEMAYFVGHLGYLLFFVLLSILYEVWRFRSSLSGGFRVRGGIAP